MPLKRALLAHVLGAHTFLPLRKRKQKDKMGHLSCWDHVCARCLPCSRHPEQYSTLDQMASKSMIMQEAAYTSSCIPYALDGLLQHVFPLHGNLSSLLHCQRRQLWLDVLLPAHIQRLCSSAHASWHHKQLLLLLLPYLIKQIAMDRSTTSVYHCYISISMLIAYAL